MQQIKTKLRSRRGASITFALLLFLVCAVIGSVVLVAGTAAAGRLSKTAEMDQRYYSVTSAAELLIDKIAGDDNSVTVMVTTDSTDPSNPTTTVKIDGADIPASFDSFTKYAAYQIAVEKLTADVEKNLSLTVTGQEALAVTIKETLSPDGTMVFELSNKNGTDKYTMQLTFLADIRKNTDSNAFLKTTTETTKLTWELHGMENVITEAVITEAATP